MQAFKCDICKEYSDGDAPLTITANAREGIESTGMIEGDFKQYMLCSTCATRFIQWTCYPIKRPLVNG